MTDDAREVRKLPLGRLLLYLGLASFVTGALSTVGDIVKSEYADEASDCRLAVDYLEMSKNAVAKPAGDELAERIAILKTADARGKELRPEHRDELDQHRKLEAARTAASASAEETQKVARDKLADCLRN